VTSSTSVRESKDMEITKNQFQPRRAKCEAIIMKQQSTRNYAEK
jgi:hypothetical protein